MAITLVMPISCLGVDEVIAVSLSLYFEAVMLLELVNFDEITSVPVLDNSSFASDLLVTGLRRYVQLQLEMS